MHLALNRQTLTCDLTSISTVPFITLLPPDVPSQQLPSCQTFFSDTWMKIIYVWLSVGDLKMQTLPYQQEELSRVRRPAGFPKVLTIAEQA